MERVFLDANVLFSAAYKRTRLRLLWDLPDVQLVSSAYAVREAELNLEQTRPEAMGELTELLKKVEILSVTNLELLPPSISLIEKDIPILQAAIGTKATHLLTGDVRHFGNLFGQSVEGVVILPPAQYLRGKDTL